MSQDAQVMFPNHFEEDAVDGMFALFPQEDITSLLNKMYTVITGKVKTLEIGVLSWMDKKNICNRLNAVQDSLAHLADYLRPVMECVMGVAAVEVVM